MSEETVQVVRQSLNRWIEVDEGLADVDQLYEFFAKDAVFETRDLPESVGGSEVHGIDEFLDVRATWIESFDDWYYSLEKLIDVGGNRVVGTFKQRGKLRGTDDWVEMRYAILYRVEEGLITWARMYLNREEALEAAGLRE